ncbi:unnamed protein product [Hymenolepis diminuta]|uniref:Uncharacterized protein n=1 Tax=Hymenolepis diminuta TaxID=6216 RepID=A0A564ZAX7_HYMDI|nr:unnamed protein product [Hymenolepis diminuta]
MNLEEGETAQKTFLSCRRHYSQTWDIKNDMDENKFEIKNSEPESPIECLLTVKFAGGEDEYESLYFEIKDGKLLNEEEYFDYGTLLIFN